MYHRKYHNSKKEAFIEEYRNLASERQRRLTEQILIERMEAFAEGRAPVEFDYDKYYETHYDEYGY